MYSGDAGVPRQKCTQCPDGQISFDHLTCVNCPLGFRPVITGGQAHCGLDAGFDASMFNLPGTDPIEGDGDDDVDVVVDVNVVVGMDSDDGPNPPW